MFVFRARSILAFVSDVLRPVYFVILRIISYLTTIENIFIYIIHLGLQYNIIHYDLKQCVILQFCCYNEYLIYNVNNLFQVYESRWCWHASEGTMRIYFVIDRKLPETWLILHTRLTFESEWEREGDRERKREREGKILKRIFSVKSQLFVIKTPATV